MKSVVPAWLLRLWHAPREGIAVVLLTRVVLFSTVITLLLTAMQLALSYQAEVAGIHNRFREMEEGYAGTLGSALWSLDGRLVQEQLDGMLQLPHIRYLEVRETAQSTHPLVVHRGLPAQRNTVVREFPVFCCDEDRSQVGVVRVEASLDEVYRDILRQALVILASNAAKTFLVALFILWIVHRVATRHIVDITTGLRKRVPGVRAAPLTLRRSVHGDDEIDELVEALNAMFARIDRHTAEIRDANTRMAAILDNIPDFAWVKDTEGRFVAANRALAESLGLKHPSELIGKTDFDVLPREQALACLADDARTMASGERQRFEEPYSHAAGPATWIETIKTPYPDSSGKPAGTVGIARDITARRRIEDELRRSESLQAAGQRLSRTGSWAWNVDTGAITWSDEHYRIYGFAPGEVQPTPEIFLSRIHPEDRPALHAFVADSLRNPRELEHEMRLALPDGTIRHVGIIAHPVRNKDGRVEEYVGIAADKTAVRLAEAEREARRAAEAANRAKTEFLATISHELRTPLNGILGYAQLLMRDQHVAPGVRARGEVIKRSGEQLLTLIDDLLNFSKIEAGKLELVPTEFSLAELLASIEELIRVRAEQKGLRFDCHAPQAASTVVCADAGKLRQVLLNLLSNAVKFTDRGHVRLEVAVSGGGGAAGATSRLRFQVTDSGVGIAQQQQLRLFQPFEQLGDARRRSGGTGLGLAISQRLVGLMGGEIRLRSQAGTGSTFWFEIDAAIGTTQRRHEDKAAVAVGYAGARRRVLVVDDIAENRAVLVDLLRALGFGTEQAANGFAAIVQSRQAVPDLILMDICMAGLDGLEAIRQLRQDAGLRDVPVIATSASARGEDETSSIAAGADVFLVKPIDHDALLLQIGRLLRLQWEYDPAPQADAARPPAAAIAVPPAAEIEQLHYLAKRGSMREIHDWAERIGELDARYRHFAARLRQLASAYQSREILRLASEHLPRPEGS
ncbi:PAS domain-containing protein [Cupriavidus necator]|uniref:PAS domain-containing protein n=1 Tax=Cupriavidus necator TaxID=106590 RepID=UPI00339D6527